MGVSLVDFLTRYSLSPSLGVSENESNLPENRRF